MCVQRFSAYTCICVSGCSGCAWEDWRMRSPSLTTSQHVPLQITARKSPVAGLNLCQEKAQLMEISPSWSCHRPAWAHDNHETSENLNQLDQVQKNINKPMLLAQRFMGGCWAEWCMPGNMMAKSSGSVLQSFKTRSKGAVTSSGPSNLGAR